MFFAATNSAGDKRKFQERSQALSRIFPNGFRCVMVFVSSQTLLESTPKGKKKWERLAYYRRLRCPSARCIVVGGGPTTRGEVEEMVEAMARKRQAEDDCDKKCKKATVVHVTDDQTHYYVVDDKLFVLPQFYKGRSWAHDMFREKNHDHDPAVAQDRKDNMVLH